MSAGLERRFLRPRYVFSAGTFIWVVDRTQPVAALFDPHTEQFARVVAWTDIPPPPPGSGQSEIVADSAGLWVQSHRDGPLARIGIDGIVRGEYTQGHRLICAGEAGAWCISVGRRRRDIAASPDVPPRRFSPRRPENLVALPDGGTRRVVVEAAAVVSVEFDESSLFVGIEHDPWTRVPASPAAGGAQSGFEVRYRSSVLQVPLDGPIPLRIGPQTHPCEQDRAVGYTSEYADSSYNEAHRRKRAVDELSRWHWGTDSARPGTTMVRAYRPDTAVPATEIELAGTRVSDGAVADGRLWMVARAERLTGSESSVLVADVDGSAHSVPVTGIDITDWCHSAGPEPLDHDSCVAYCVTGLNRMQFSDYVHEVSAAYVGQCPHGSVHIRFRHVDYPGVTLVAPRRLYDEFGGRLDGFLTYVPAQLMEQAGTRAYPPVSEAVDGVLYV
ncbi:hypothetical protein [Rhodococcus sp. SGAir0479]|uniref:hypothetical protein n=1 Tax=Rhodococcus sp. SGAir0479 TaxID=2567884 RepID=UPI0010CD52A5|nr:hypothetical protein [Rhodococcus sp. SGAir0479]QCQ91387.1 hypothetical protein E7742_09140 [Rhodococcus sp. SGAir0479]